MRVPALSVFFSNFAKCVVWPPLIVCFLAGQVPLLQASVVVAPFGALTVKRVIVAPVAVKRPESVITGLGLMRLRPGILGPGVVGEAVIVKFGEAPGLPGAGPPSVEATTALRSEDLRLDSSPKETDSVTRSILPAS